MNMLEDIAKAIWDADQSFGRRIGRAWMQADDFERSRTLACARAVVEAMREPTEEMIVASASAYSAALAKRHGADASHVLFDDLRPALRAMIDAVLSQP